MTLLEVHSEIVARLSSRGWHVAAVWLATLILLHALPSNLLRLAFGLALSAPVMWYYYHREEPDPLDETGFYMEFDPVTGDAIIYDESGEEVASGSTLVELKDELEELMDDGLITLAERDGFLVHAAARPGFPQA